MRPNGRPQAALGERGATVVELVIWAPLVALILAFLVFSFRAGTTRSEVDAAARAAARAAAGERTSVDAVAAGTDAAASILTTDICESPTITIDISDWAGGTVSATVTCVPRTAGIPWNRTVSSTWTEAVSKVRRGR